MSLRLWALWAVPTQPVSDYWSYYQGALNLYRYGHYEAFVGIPNASHPPGYSILLALGFLVTGGVHTLAVAKLMNTGLSGLSILFAALMARDLWGDRAGLFAALLSALYPRYLLMVCILASENLFTPLLLLFLFVSIRSSLSEYSPKGAALGGVLVGLLALTRTVAYSFGVIWLLSAVAGRKKLRSILLEGLLLVGVQHAVMLPWAVRNHFAMGRATFLTSSGGMGLFNGNNPNATGGWYDWREDLERVAPGIFTKSALEVDDAARRAAIVWMRQHPVEAARLYVEKLRLIAVEDNTIADWAVLGQKTSPPFPGIDVLPWPHYLKDHPRGFRAVLRVAAGVIAFLGGVGLVTLVARAVSSRLPVDWSVAVTLLAGTVYIPLFSAMIAVNGRYRWPAEDVSMVIAASLLAASGRLRIKGSR